MNHPWWTYDIDDGTINFLILPDYTVFCGADQWTSSATPLFSSPPIRLHSTLLHRGRREFFSVARRQNTIELNVFRLPSGALDWSDGLCTFSSPRHNVVMTRVVVTDRISRWADVVWREIEWQRHWSGKRTIEIAICANESISTYVTLQGEKIVLLRFITMLLWR